MLFVQNLNLNALPSNSILVNLLSYRLAQVMNENFDTRQEIYSDASLGEANLQMVNIARKHGSAVKFLGSGGAVCYWTVSRPREKKK